MDNPWGLSGPEFLQLYGVGLAVAVVLAFWIRFAARRPDPDARTDSRGLTPVELGYLIGGAERAAETAVAGLLARDVLRASRGGHVSSTGAPALADPVERAAHDYLDGARRPVALLLGRVASSRAVTELGARLADRGLLVPVTRKERTAARSALPLVVLAVIGLVRAVHGGALGFPIGYLVLFLIATGVLAGVVWWLPVCWRTQAGDDLVERLTAQPGTAAADLVARNG
ncbi:TIGR04222 domain-containing membrane protein, partial [Crossiella equi]